MIKDKEKTYEILKKAAYNTFVYIKKGELEQPRFININIITQELFSVVGAEKSCRNFINTMINLKNIFNVDDHLMVTKINYLKLTSYIVDNITEIENTTSKLKEDIDEHIKSNILLAGLMLIVDSLKEGMFVSIDLKYMDTFFKKVKKEMK